MTLDERGEETWRLVAVLLVAVAALVLIPVQRASAGVTEGDSPELTVTTVEGGEVSLQDLRGSVVLLDFWATWCPPCQVSFPFYKKLAEKYGDRGLEVLAVSIDEDEGAVERFLEERDVPFRVAVDSEKSLASRFEPPAMPTAFLIDHEGVVREIHEGFHEEDKSAIEARVVELLEAREDDGDE